MNPILTRETHASRVKYLHVVHGCGHTVEVKVSPTISAAYVREIRREANHQLCLSCQKIAGIKSRRAK